MHGTLVREHSFSLNVAIIVPCPVVPCSLRMFFFAYHNQKVFKTVVLKYTNKIKIGKSSTIQTFYGFLSLTVSRFSVLEYCLTSGTSK
jgi:hypothetical protein